VFRILGTPSEVGVERLRRGEVVSPTKLAMQGAVAVAVAITVKTCWTIAHPHYKPGARVRVILIAGTAFVLHVGLGVSAIHVLLGAAVIGLLLPEVPA